MVAAPSKIPRSVSAGAKTDRLDCLKLARYAAKGLIRPIAIQGVSPLSWGPRTRGDQNLALGS